MIENEKSYNRKASHGELGVRMQSSGHHSDITADTAVENIITTEGAQEKHCQLYSQGGCK